MRSGWHQGRLHRRALCVRDTQALSVTNGTSCRQPGGDQLGYASFQDIKSAENSITFYQGYQGLGGRGLQCELLPPNQGAGGSAGHKRLREDGESGVQDSGLSPPGCAYESHPRVLHCRRCCTTGSVKAGAWRHTRHDAPAPPAPAPSASAFPGRASPAPGPGQRCVGWAVAGCSPANPHPACCPEPPPEPPIVTAATEVHAAGLRAAAADRWDRVSTPVCACPA